jgi:hypothetical protein
MKQCIIYLSLMVTVFAWSCSSGNKKTSEKTNHSSANVNGMPEIQFDTTYYDFGTLVQGEQAAYTFRFENTGTADLIIYDAYSTCGCTVPEYSNEPINPGSKGKIDVVFNSEGKRGLQYKTVTLKLNTEQKEKTLTIKANVIENNYKS